MPPLKNTHPRVPRYPPPGSPTRRALTAKLLRPLLTACPFQREPRAQQGGPANGGSIGLLKRTGRLLSANDAVTDPDAQTRKEGGRETLRGEGEGGEDGETVSAASTAAAASLLPGKSRPLRRPAQQRKD